MKNSTSKIKYDQASGIPNKLISGNEITTFNGDVIERADETARTIYDQAAGIPDKFIDENGDIKKLAEIMGGGGGGIEEAPSDGEIYGRQSKRWQKTITEQRMIETEDFTGHLSIRIGEVDNKAENANRDIQTTNRNLEQTNIKVSDLENDLDKKIDDAKDDGVSYTRNSNDWEAFATRDGIKWGTMPSISKNAWEKVIYAKSSMGLGHYIAVASAGDDPRMMVGFHGHIRKSDDDATGSIEWHFVEEAPEKELHSIAYGWNKDNWSTVLVAVGKDCAFRNMWSNPMYWEEIENIPEGDWKDIISVGDYDYSPMSYRNTEEKRWSDYYAVGKDKAMLSLDGAETWELAEAVPQGNWQAVVYRKINKIETLVAVGEDKIMFSSTTMAVLGRGWQYVESTRMPADLDLNDIACDGYMFVAVGKDRVVYSTNVADWQEAPRILDKNWVSIAYGNGIWVAVSDSGCVMTSFDGISWVIRQDDINNEAAISSICYADFSFLSVSKSYAHNIILSSIGHASNALISAIATTLESSRPMSYSRGLHSIGEWIDNAPIMECIFEGKTANTKGNLAVIGTIKHGVDALVEVAGYIDGKDGLKVPLGHDNIRITDGKNVCVITNDLTNCNVTAVIRYTTCKKAEPEPRPPAPTTLFMNPDNTLCAERIVDERLIEVSENNASNITITFYDDKGKEIGKTTEQVISHGWKDFNAKIKSDTIANIKLETEESVAEFIADEPFVYDKNENNVRAELFLMRNSKDKYADGMLYITFGEDKHPNKLSITG